MMRGLPWSYLALAVACGRTPPPEAVVPEVPAAIPEIAPVPAANTIPELSEPAPMPTDMTLAQPVGDALVDIPPELDTLYLFSLSADRQQLTIDPQPAPARRARDLAPGGFTAADSARGGKILTLEGGPFRNGRWVSARLREIVPDDARQGELVRAGYDLDTVRSLLVVDGESESTPTTFAFSLDPNKLGLVGICTRVTPVDFGVPTPPQVVRKPVIYLYPERESEVTVDVRLSGAGAQLSSVYPAMDAQGWTVTASPTGRLTDARTGRSHRYLFWEGRGAQFILDPRQAHLVARGDAAIFLERLCDASALTDEECGDFVTYWLPELESHPYTLVQLLSEEDYSRYATLIIHPEPDTLIRLFVLLRGEEVPVPAGNPALPQRQREGFVAVEWGGVAL